MLSGGGKGEKLCYFISTAQERVSRLRFAWGSPHPRQPSEPTSTLFARLPQQIFQKRKNNVFGGLILYCLPRYQALEALAQGSVWLSVAAA